MKAAGLLADRLVSVTSVRVGVSLQGFAITHKEDWSETRNGGCPAPSLSVTVVAAL